MGLFDQTVVNRPAKNVFKLNHDHITTFDFGKLIPISTVEVLPGDSFNISYQSMDRFQALLSPMYQDCEVRCDTYFVPYRLLWKNWEDFISGQITKVNPYFVWNDSQDTGSLGAYFGLPTDAGFGSDNVNVFMIAAYAMIYDHYYSSDHLHTTKKYVEVTDGDNSGAYEGMAEGMPFKVCHRHDYFTSALPSAQFSSPVNIPLVDGGSVDVEYKQGVGAAGQLRKSSDDSLIANAGTLSTDAGGDLQSNSPTPNVDVFYDPNGTLEVDLETDAVTVGEFRLAISLQSYLEKLMRTGTRAHEWLRGIWGVTPEDGRLNRPEHVGTMVSKMSVSEVLQSATTYDSSDNANPVGTMAGHGISVAGSRRIQTREFKEHGVLLTLKFVRPKQAYYQGIERMWNRKTYLDYAIPDFAHIGEQAILNKELYAAHSSPEGVFGYVPRFSEYRMKNNLITGEFRSTLEYWHASRKYSSEPTLNTDFIEVDDDDHNRVFAVTTAAAEKILSYNYFTVYVHRSLPKWGIPKI